MLPAGIILCLLLPYTLTKNIEIKCPEHCQCDIFENLRRATCSNRHIVNIESHLPSQTQLLDLSYNQIIKINDKVFEAEGLLDLKLLNISHNKVSDIHLYAFRGLRRLKTLDLSYNGVQYIQEHWFWELDSLEELYFKGNSFRKLDKEPLFSSKTLKKLDFSSCGINFVGDKALSDLPSLEVLDLSDNNLIRLRSAVIEPLPNVNLLNLNLNQLSCDGTFEELSILCKRKGVRLVSSCNKEETVEEEKFQRMVNAVEPDDEKNSWIYDDGEEIRSDNETKTIKTCNNTRDDKSLLQEIVDLSPLLAITFPFIYGIAVGVLAAYIMHVFTRRKKELNSSTYFNFDDGETHNQSRRNSRIRRSRRFSRSFSTEDRQNLPLREWTLSESTPVLFRKNQAQV